MEIDDDFIFTEYHDSRKEGMPFEYFYRTRHIKIPERKFWILYERWRKESGIPLMIPTSIQYMEWMLDHFNADPHERDRARNISLSIQGISLNFTELVIASTIIVLVMGVLREVMAVSGLSLDPISRCKNRIGEIRPVMVEVRHEG